jgi:hypothetical protein
MQQTFPCVFLSTPAGLQRLLEDEHRPVTGFKCHEERTVQLLSTWKGDY